MVAAVLGYLGGSEAQMWVTHDNILFSSQDMTTLASVFSSNPHHSPARKEGQETVHPVSDSELPHGVETMCVS